MPVNVELEESIKKWEDIVAGKDKDKGQLNCALCKKYMDTGCEGCVVSQDTTKRYCYDTPFRAWFNHHRMEHMYLAGNLGRKVECPTCREWAQKELDYLKSLRA